MNRYASLGFISRVIILKWNIPFFTTTGFYTENVKEGIFLKATGFIHRIAEAV